MKEAIDNLSNLSVYEEEVCFPKESYYLEDPGQGRDKIRNWIWKREADEKGEEAAPLFSFDSISAFGKKSLLMEVYDTQVAPIDLSTMDAVKDSYHDLKDRQPKTAWYDNLRLSPSTFKEGNKVRLSRGSA